MVGGPLRPSLPRPEWIEDRALFLSEQYGESLLRVRNDLLEQEQLLDAALREDEEIVLWFEHDLYCLMHLLYLMQRLARSRRLSLVWSPQPIGTTPEEEIFQLF